MSTDLETNLQIIEEFTQRLQVAVIGAEETTVKHTDWVDGPVDGVIETANGPLKTLRGQIAEWRLAADQDVASAIDGYDLQFAASLAQFEVDFEEYLLTVGFEPSVEYVAGIDIVRRAQTVVYGGVTYYWIGFLPHTTTGDFGTEVSWQIAPIVGGIEVPGFNFATGGKLLRKTQSVLGLDGEWYFWTGSFPKTITPGSTLESAGGVGENLFKISSGFPPLRSTFSLNATSMGYELNEGSFESGATISVRTSALIQFLTGKTYRWEGTLPKVVDLNSTPLSSGGIGSGKWVELDISLASSVTKPITWSGFSGGADASGVTPSDAAFTDASLYEGDVRVEGTFSLSDIVTRTKSVMELPPGSSITKNKLAGPSTANGANIPSKTMFGRLVIRDEDTTPPGSDSFVTYPDMGQALRIDSKQVQGQCGMFLGGDRKLPVIGGTAYVGLHTRHDQSVATPKLWGLNPVVVKNVRAVDLPVGVSSETIGMEISVSNNTDERGQALGAGALEGLFISYINVEKEASAAVATGGLSAGFRTLLWLDGVTPQGTHIQLRDEVSGNGGARCGIDTTGVSAFSDAAIILGRGHSIASQDTGGSLRPLFYINSANELVQGSTSLATRHLGTISVFDHSIRPGSDNVYDYGSATFRGRTAYFGTGTINTSDERHKPIIERIPDSLLDAWAEVDWGNRYKFDDAVEEKGADGARWHFGLIAQRIRDVLTKHDIDGFSLGLLCYDEWGDEYEDEQINIGETVIKIKPVTVKKTVKKAAKETAIVRNDAGDLVFVEVDVVKEEPVLVMEYVKDIDGNFVIKEDGTKMTIFTQLTEEVEKEYDAPAEPVYVRKLVKAAGNRYGIRYEEALSLEAALQRRERERDRRSLKELKDMVEALLKPV